MRGADSRSCSQLVAAATSSSSAAPAGAADLSRTAARRTVERSVHQAYPDLAFGNVACPDRVRRARGATFTCTVQLPGTFLVVEATQTNGDGNVSLTTQQAVIPTQLLRAVRRGQLLVAAPPSTAARHRSASPRAGEKIVCGVRLADGTARTVELTVQDTAGNVTVTAVS